MSPQLDKLEVASRPRYTLFLCVLAFTIATPSLSHSQPKPSKKSKKTAKKEDKEKSIAKVKEKKNKQGGKDQTFDFTGLSLGGSVRTPQLLYFLDRASEELKRASLERRSFVPEMILSISEEGL